MVSLSSRKLSVCIFLCAIGAAGMLFLPELAEAGIGGQFSKAVGKSPFGRYIGGLLAVLMLLALIILLPLLLYVWIGEYKGTRRALADLSILAESHDCFKWETISESVSETILVLHEIWESGNIDAAADLMVPRYLNSQQEMLDRWKKDGKHNVLNLRKIVSLAPLKVSTGSSLSNPQTWVRVKLDVQDFLLDELTGELLKGSREDERVTQIWRMEYLDAVWRLAAVEPEDDSLKLALEQNQLDLDHLPERAQRATVFNPAPMEQPQSEEAVLQSQERE